MIVKANENKRKRIMMREKTVGGSVLAKFCSISTNC